METHVNTEQVLANLILRAAHQMAQGKTRSEVIDTLEAEGISPDTALLIATKAEAIKKAEFRKGGQTSMLIGAGLAGLGIVITAATYSAASSGGGHYVITYGLIFGGAGLFLKGLWRSMAG